MGKIDTTQYVVYFHLSVGPISTKIYSCSRTNVSIYEGHSIVLWRHGLTFHPPSQNKRRENRRPLKIHVTFNQTGEHSFVLLKNAMMIYVFYFIWSTVYKVRRNHVKYARLYSRRGSTWVFNYKYVFILFHSSVSLVRERTIPTERSPPVGEVSANFCG